MHTLPHPPTPSQKKVTTTHTHPHHAKKVTLTHAHSHPAKKRSHPTKKGHTHPHPPTPSQKRWYPPTSAHMQSKKVILTYTSCKSMEKKSIHKLIKFIRNSRSLKYNFCEVQCQAIGISISTQYRTNDKQVSCCHKQF